MGNQIKITNNDAKQAPKPWGFEKGVPVKGGDRKLPKCESVPKPGKK